LSTKPIGFVDYLLALTYQRLPSSPSKCLHHPHHHEPVLYRQTIEGDRSEFCSSLGFDNKVWFLPPQDPVDGVVGPPKREAQLRLGFLLPISMLTLLDVPDRHVGQPGAAHEFGLIDTEASHPFGDLQGQSLRGFRLLCHVRTPSRATISGN
jgi:hypothetical protein